MYLYNNGGSLLVGLDHGCFSCVVQTPYTLSDQMQSTHYADFRRSRYICEWYKSRFHSNAVWMRQMNVYQFLKGIFSTMRQYCIVELSAVFYARFIGCICFILFASIYVLSFVIFFSRLSHNCYVHHIFSHFPHPLYMHSRFSSNVHTLVMHIIWFQLLISVSEVLNIIGVLFKQQQQLLTSCLKIQWYVLYRIHCCSCLLIRLFLDVFSTFVNTERTVTCIISFTITFIPSL